MEKFAKLEKELSILINSLSIDTILGIPDFMIAEYMVKNLLDVNLLKAKLEVWKSEKK